MDATRDIEVKPAPPAGGKLRQVVTAMWIALGVAAAGKAIVEPVSHTVYPVFALGARHWWQDVSLYANYAPLDLFRYSPTFALIMTPFALLPDRIGGALWALVNVGVLYCAVRVLIRDVLPGVWAEIHTAAILTLTLIAAARGVWSGQSNALLASLALFGAAAIVRQRWWQAAFLLALPVFFKIWPLALLLLLVWAWPRQLIGRALAAMGCLAAVPFLTRAPSTVLWHYQEWWTHLTGSRLERWPGFRDAWTIWDRLFPPVNSTAYTILQLATAVLVFLWCLWQYWRSGSPQRRLTAALSMWLAWQLLFGPGTERLTYIIIAPLLGWAVVASFIQQRGRTLSTLAWLTVSLLGTGGVERALLPYWPAAPIILPLGVVVFVVWLVCHRWPTEREAPAG